MKLYELPRLSLFRLIDDHPQVPVDALQPTDTLDVYKLINIDGMYSHVVNNQTKEVFHFAAWTEVNPL